jgi:hypothetical protein
MDHQEGICCSLFRNEGHELPSSRLILEAEWLAIERWGPGRAYTYVNPRKIRSCNPGCCFKMAGWKRSGTTKRGLYLFHKQLR